MKQRTQSNETQTYDWLIKRQKLFTRHQYELCMVDCISLVSYKSIVCLGVLIERPAIESVTLLTNKVEW